MTHHVVETHIDDMLCRAGVRSPKDIGCAGDKNGTYHISFTLEQDLTFDLLDRLADVFQTKQINFTYQHEDSESGRCYSFCACYEPSKTYFGVNIYQARVDDMPAIPEPRKYVPPPPTPEPPKVVWWEYLCAEHLDEVAAAFPGWWVRLRPWDSSVKCNVKGCPREAFAEFNHEEGPL